MDGAATATRRRVLRILLASGFLAAAWVAIDLVSHSEPAAAAETTDLVPLVDDTVDSLTSAVDSAVVPIVTTVTEPVEPIVSTAVAEAVSPLVTEVVTPVVVPIIEAAGPIVAPIVTPILVPVVEVVDLVTPIVSTASSAVGGNQTFVGGAVSVGSLLAASTIPLLVTPSNGAPRNAPTTPTEPTSANGSVLLAMYGELNSGIRAAWSALRTGPDLGDAVPASPTFAFDTTPD